MNFYERSAAERVELTKAAIRGQRTFMTRWATLKDAEANPWSQRAALAAQFLADMPSVADFGCGTLLLEKHLRDDQLYIPLDVVQRDSRTIVCDLNAAPPPPTSAKAAAALGLLEYLHDPASTLRDLALQYPLLVCSYCMTDAVSAPQNRLEHGWVNDLSRSQLEETFAATGWRIERFALVDGIQGLWRLGSKAGRNHDWG